MREGQAAQLRRRGQGRWTADGLGLQRLQIFFGRRKDPLRIWNRNNWVRSECYQARNNMLTAVDSQRIRQFETIFKAHAQLMYRTAYGVLGTHHDAEDVVQTIFLKLLRQEIPPALERNPEGDLYWD